ncbi:hypothetical protein [Microcoleus sp. D2_18a_D3]|uniref:hypothetical protein n=1 Tax=Microcoleus sp. D2_18a_D3 TaxID=3055330 RepID=UPI002FD184FC
MMNVRDYRQKINRLFYTSLTLISAILLGGLGKLSESNNNTALAQESIPVSGSGDAQLQPILQSLTEFMRHRCVGAAVLGVSVKGKPVGVWGFGRMKGRPTNNWNPACGEGYAGSSGCDRTRRYPHAYGQYQQACYLCNGALGA